MLFLKSYIEKLWLPLPQALVHTKRLSLVLKVEFIDKMQDVYGQ